MGEVQFTYSLDRPLEFSYKTSLKRETYLNLEPEEAAEENPQVRGLTFEYKLREAHA